VPLGLTNLCTRGGDDETTNTAISNNLYWLADENLSIDEGQGENNFFCSGLILFPVLLFSILNYFFSV
jgi:hypothetical protein